MMYKIHYLGFLSEPFYVFSRVNALPKKQINSKIQFLHKYEPYNKKARTGEGKI